MKIIKFDIFAIQLPLKNPFVVSYASYDTMPSIIVKLTADNGLVGYGEGVADEHVTGESWDSTFHILKTSIAPKLIGENPMEIERIHEIMDKTIKNVPTAKAAIDIACYDVVGKYLNTPVYSLIGGRYHEKFPITHVLSIDEPQKMANEAEQYVFAGYRSFKMKVGTDLTLDIERVKAVRNAVGKDISIRIDVNQGWENSSVTLLAIDRLRDMSLDWIEQPVIAADIDSMAELRVKLNTPLMIDEGLLGIKEMREIIAKKAANKVNIKLMKCGGIYPATKLAHMAEMAGIECQIGSMVESSVGSAAGFHVAFSKKVIKTVELTGPLKFMKDIGDLQFDIPFIQLEDKPGLGISIDEDVLRELTVYQTYVK